MNKLRKRLLICLVIIFVFTFIGFLFAFMNDSRVDIAGASVIGSDDSPAPSALAMFMPGILFIGFLIMTVWHLERK